MPWRTTPTLHASGMRIALVCVNFLDITFRRFNVSWYWHSVKKRLDFPERLVSGDPKFGTTASVALVRERCTSQYFSRRLASLSISDAGLLSAPSRNFVILGNRNVIPGEKASDATISPALSVTMTESFG